MASAEGVAGIGGVAGEIIGGAGGVAGNFLTDFTSYISSMGVVEWILILIVVLGSFLVYHLKKKYNLKFSFGPKKPKKAFY